MSSVFLFQAGASVTISDLKEDVGAATVKELRERFGKERVHFVVCNVTKNEDLERMFQESEDFFKAPVDILVNNAGVNTNLGWKVCMDVNIMAVMAATLMAIDKMKGRVGCKILNIASMAGIVPGFDTESLSYFVSKHGVVSLSRTLAANKHQHGVDFLCLCPSWANTDIVNKVLPEFKNEIETQVKKLGLMEPNRVGEAFMALLALKNGTVLSVMHNAPLMELPDISRTRTFATYTIGKLLQRTFGVELVQKWHLTLSLLMLLMLIHFILRIMF